MAEALAEQLIERFFRYLAVESQSDAKATVVPSTPGQRRLAEMLKAELEAIGLADIHLDEHSVLTARLPGTMPQAPCIGFVAHLDTVDVGLSPEVRPQRLMFDGNDLLLNTKEDIWLRVSEHPEILPYHGQEVLVSDGTSVLGADNKAAIAILMTLMARLKNSTTPRGDIIVAFVPDEEIGLRGAKVMDLSRFPVAYAYTIDCCERGEVVYETFNAASVTVDITGVTAHPMTAKGVLVNPILVATELVQMFDPMQTPEQTEGREGYWWCNGISGNQSSARLQMSIRDHDGVRFEERKAFVAQAVEAIRARHPRARIECRIEDSYQNIDAAMGNDRHCVDLIFQALRQMNITPKVIAMRGGTDGSALSARGVPTPNYFTGAHNFHSRFEFLPVNSFVDSCKLTEELCSLATKPRRDSEVLASSQA
ncbi:peptidase T [Pseudoroseomonas ludipueritiae]|uniref:Peptidase T n=1 Tax=Pseudoroseomonas ludipueritiae TaxID=198093 RepID=A0ABR7R2K4_9PROT|nr:peptidase T [Pseudoroseomonas ludipueritiae]MBC9175902.1 peptidase T [Pseudoroseomonas ludipueritiae]